MRAEPSWLCQACGHTFTFPWQVRVCPPCQERRVQQADVTFPDLPRQVRRALAREGYTARAQVRRATDAELLRCRNLGRRWLAAVRAVLPYQPVPQRPCPHCDGTGWVPEAPDAR